MIICISEIPYNQGTFPLDNDFAFSVHFNTILTIYVYIDEVVENSVLGGSVKFHSMFPNLNFALGRIYLVFFN